MKPRILQSKIIYQHFRYHTIHEVEDENNFGYNGKYYGIGHEKYDDALADLRQFYEKSHDRWVFTVYRRREM